MVSLRKESLEERKKVILKVFLLLSSLGIFKNVIDVILEVQVLTTEIGPSNPMHDAPTHFEPKEVGYNINVCKDAIEDANEDLNEDQFVSEDVKNNESEVINANIAYEIFVVRKLPRKRNKIAYIILENNIEELVTHTLDVINEDENINKGVINVKMYIEGKKLPENTLSNPFDIVYFHFEESIAKCNFVYHRRMTLEKEPYVKHKIQ